MAKRAFTLIEVVIAAAILAVSLSMVITTIVMLKRTAFSASNRLDALHEAREQMEKLMALSYNSTGLDVGPHTFESSSGSFTGSYVVTTNTLPGIKDIALTVYWCNPGASVVSSNMIMSAVSDALH